MAYCSGPSPSVPARLPPLVDHPPGRIEGTVEIGDTVAVSSLSSLTALTPTVFFTWEQLWNVTKRSCFTVFISVFKPRFCRMATIATVNESTGNELRHLQAVSNQSRGAERDLHAQLVPTHRVVSEGGGVERDTVGEEENTVLPIVWYGSEGYSKKGIWLTRKGGELKYCGILGGRSFRHDAIEHSVAWLLYWWSITVVNYRSSQADFIICLFSLLSSLVPDGQNNLFSFAYTSERFFLHTCTWWIEAIVIFPMRLFLNE